MNIGTTFLSLFISTGISSAVAGDPAPLSITDCSVGEAYVFTTPQCRLHIANSSSRTVMATIGPVAPEDSVDPSSIEIPAHGSIEVTATVAIGNAPGDGTHLFKVHPEGGTASDSLAKVNAFGMSALDDVRPRADFKSVDLSTKTAAPITLTLGSHDAPGFRILRLLSAPPGIDALISPDGHTISLNVRPDAPWSVIDDYVKVAIDTPHQKEAWIAVKAEVHGEISAVSNPVWFGIVPPDGDRKVLIPLRDKKGRDFQIGNISLRDVEGTTRTLACEPSENGCKIVELDISKQQHAGWLRGVVTIDLPDFSKSLAVSVWGILQYPKSESSNAATQSAQASSASSAVAASAPKIDSAMQAHARAPDPPFAPNGRGPLLKWSVVNDDGVHGYQIFRSAMESGPFLLLNPETIPSKVSDSSGAQNYEWRDESAEKGKTYWYYIGIVNKDGTKRKLSNPHKKVVTE